MNRKMRLTSYAWVRWPVQSQNSSEWRDEAVLPTAVMAAGKSMALLFEAELAISLLLMEVTLRKPWSQREGPELCNVWTVPSQVKLPSPLVYLALWWVMIITLSFEIDTIDCLYRRLAHCKKKYLRICFV